MSSHGPGSVDTGARERLREAASDALTWIENYPLNDRLTDDWAAVADSLREALASGVGVPPDEAESLLDADDVAIIAEEAQSAEGADVRGLREKVVEAARALRFTDWHSEVRAAEVNTELWHDLVDAVDALAASEASAPRRNIDSASAFCRAGGGDS